MIAAISTKIKFYRINMKIKSSDSGLTKEAVLNALAKGWSEVLPSELFRQRAERLLSIHPLRAADAFQLAAALIWAEEAPQGLKVVCLDQNLREGAFKEGFTVLP
jgi:predicted nucleic acid-binding protein